MTQIYCHAFGGKLCELGIDMDDNPKEAEPSDLDNHNSLGWSIYKHEQDSPKELDQ